MELWAIVSLAGKYFLPLPLFSVLKRCNASSKKFCPGHKLYLEKTECLFGLWKLCLFIIRYKLCSLMENTLFWNLGGFYILACDKTCAWDFCCWLLKWLSVAVRVTRVMCLASGVRSMHSTDIQWSAILSWGYADNILRLKSKQSEPPVNFIQSSQLHQVKRSHSLALQFNSGSLSGLSWQQ